MHTDNKKKDILVLIKSPTNGLNYATLAAREICLGYTAQWN